MESIIAALIPQFTRYAVGKIKRLSGKEFELTLEVKKAVFGEWSDGTVALLTLIELTNLSAKNVQISELRLVVSEGNEYPQRFIAEHKLIDSAASVLSIRSGSILSMFEFKETWDFTEPLWRPYLRENEGALGVAVFSLPKNENIEKLSVKVLIAGRTEALEADLF